MKTKEGIDFINDLSIYIKSDYPEFEEYKKHFIDLLEQGEKYETMWKALYNTFEPYNTTEIISKEVNNKLNWDELIQYVMKKVEKKYLKGDN